MVEVSDFYIVRSLYNSQLRGYQLFIAVQGVGAGGIASLTQIIISDLVPLQERGTYNGLIALCVNSMVEHEAMILIQLSAELMD